MSRRIAVAAMIAALGLTALDAGAQGVKQQGASVAAARGATNKSWDELLSAAKAGDATKTSTYYTTDAVIIDPAMATLRGRANIEKMMKEWFASSKFLGMTRQASTFEVYGDVAIETGTNSASMQEKGKPVSKSDGRYTILWKNVDGKWLVHRDVTTPMPPKQ